METGSRLTSESLDRDGEERTAGRSRSIVPSGWIYRRVTEEGYRFRFTQLLRILEMAFPESPNFGERAVFSECPVRLQPSADLVFPPSDVKQVRVGPEGVRVVATFQGLYGIDSPLPYHFYEPLARRPRRTAPNRHFLDIFNHRLYAFFYRAWKKWRPSLHFRERGLDRHSRRFLSLAGVGNTETVTKRGLPPMRVAALAGIIGRRHHNAEGLETLLGTFFEDITIDVVENVPRWVSIPSRPQLGRRGFQLGGATIGEQVYDRSGKFRICLGSLSLSQYRTLIPGSESAEIVRKLVHLYVPAYLEYEVELRLPVSELPKTALGRSGSQLGYTTSLGEPAASTLSRIVAYE